MISTDFAPNETWPDAFVSLRLLLQPWKWNDKSVQKKAEQSLLALFQNNTEPDKFEKKIFFFLTGRAALFFAVKSLGLPKKSEILIQAFTCAAVPLPIIAADYTPVYVDIEPESYSMDMNDLMKKYTPRAKVLLLQHTYGLTPKFRNKILAFAREKNITVIEDIAHGWNPKKLKNPQNLLLSFGRSKALSSVFGGAIVTTDPTMQRSLSTLKIALVEPSTNFIFRTLLYKPLAVLIKATYRFTIGKIIHTITKKINLLIPEITAVEKMGQFDAYLAKSYPPVLAALLLEQIKRFDDVSTKRSRVAEQYSQKIDNKKTNAGPLTRYPVRVSDRESVLQQAAHNSIYLGNWYNRPIGGVNFDLETIGYAKGSCPNAEQIAGEIINLPTLIDQKDIEKVVSYF